MLENRKMKEMSEDERPYEKCLYHGAEQLSDSELLAVLLRTGTKGMNALELAGSILQSPIGSENVLNIHQLTLQKLKDIKGIGTVKAIQILCLSELAKRMAKQTAKAGLILTQPSTIADYYMEEMRHQKQEYIKLLMLNTKTKLIGEKTVSKGTVNASLISPRELFIEALSREAVSIILLHNHPSGDPTPSPQDIEVTKRLIKASEILGIKLLDHVIVGNGCFTSMKSEGYFGD